MASGPFLLLYLKKPEGTERTFFLDTLPHRTDI